MAFTIRLTDGTVLTTVDDGTIDDTTCDLTLIGKNYVGYGTIYNDNLVHLLENFSSDSAPENPLEGQLWWDKAGNLKVYTGSVSGFKTLGTVNTSNIRPATSVTGSSWWDTVNQQLYVYNGTDWILVGPAFSANVGTSGLVTELIKDTDDNVHTVSTLYVQSQVLGIYSKDQEFYPEPLINGFSTIKPGFNFISDAVINDISLWGSASQLGGVSYQYYARTDIDTTFDENVTVTGNVISSGNVSGTYFLGNGAFLTGVTSYTNANVQSYLPIYSGNLVSLTGNVITTANVTGSYFLGNGRFLTGMPATYSNANVQSYLPTYTGNLVSLTGNVISTANVHADYFVGTALEALYADLAEMFLSDGVYTPGTLVKIGGDYEITQENNIASDNVFGVISSDPAYLMNASLTNALPVALSGKVPVRVIGTSNKGDRLISAGNGLAKSGDLNEITPFNIIGRSLENKYNENEELILAFVSINK